MRRSESGSFLGLVGALALTAFSLGCATEASTDGEGGSGGTISSTSTGSDGGGGSDTTTTTVSSTTSTTTSGGGGGVPEGDTCDTAIEIVEGLVLEGVDFSQFADDYTFSSNTCESSEFGYKRHEVVFVRDMKAGDTMQITEHGALAVNMHAVAGTCGAGECAASVANQTQVQEATDGLIYTSPINQLVYFFVESFYDDSPGSQQFVDITTQSFDVRFNLVRCGDGSVASIEGCDDGNNVSGDGCSASCTLEPGFFCSGQPSVCGPVPSCTNPVLAVDGSQFTGPDIYQFTNNHTLNGSGCASSATTARPDLTFRVNLLAGQTLRVTEHGSVDALIHLQTGACGATTSCTASTDADTTGITYFSATAQTVHVFLEPWSASSPSTGYDLRFSITTCGNGIREATEACDDGNSNAGDGCSPSCTVETGFLCNTASPSVCEPLPPANCASPIAITNGYTFTFGDLTSFGDSIGGQQAATCITDGTNRVDAIFSRALAAGQRLRVRDVSTTSLVLKVLNGGTCANGTHCAAASNSPKDVTYHALVGETVHVVAEAFSTATSVKPVDLRFSICGNGVVEDLEECDDGNNVGGDGCSPTCTTQGFTTILSGCAAAGGTLFEGVATGVPAAIPDNQPNGGAILTIPVTTVGTVHSMAMRFSATHGWVADVDIWLTGPNGMPASPGLDVCTDNGGSASNFTNTVFVDTAATPITSGSAPFTGMYRPEQAFSYFNGMPANGTWTLRVADDESAITGSVTQWELGICVIPN